MLHLFCLALLHLPEAPLQADALRPNPGCGCHICGSVGDLSTCRDVRCLGQTAVTPQVPDGAVWLLAA